MGFASSSLFNELESMVKWANTFVRAFGPLFLKQVHKFLVGNGTKMSLKIITVLHDFES